MDSSKVAQSMRLEQWAKEYQEFKASGLQQKQWCKINDMSESTFSYRMRKLRNAASEVMETQEIPIPIFEPMPRVVKCMPSREFEDGCIHVKMGDKSISIQSNAPVEYLKLILGAFFNA